MKFLKKIFIIGISTYMLGWLLLIINGMRILEVIGYSLCFAGIFLLSVFITLLPDRKTKDQLDKAGNKSKRYDGIIFRLLKGGLKNE